MGQSCPVDISIIHIRIFSLFNYILKLTAVHVGLFVYTDSNNVRRSYIELTGCMDSWFICVQKFV